MITAFSVLEAMLLVMALSLDAFVSGFAYGADKIIIPFVSVTVINIVCSAVLAASLLLGGVIKAYIPENLTIIICFVTLFILGLIKIFDCSLKAYIKKRSAFRKRLAFSLFSLKCILDIYADPAVADRDKSQTLSPTEAAYLAIALSLDGLAVGFGAGITNTNIFLVILFSLIAGMAAVMLGCYLGNKAAQKCCADLSWLSGAILLALAFMKVL